MTYTEALIDAYEHRDSWAHPIAIIQYLDQENDEDAYEALSQVMLYDASWSGSGRRYTIEHLLASELFEDPDGKEWDCAEEFADVYEDLEG